MQSREVANDGLSSTLHCRSGCWLMRLSDQIGFPTTVDPDGAALGGGMSSVTMSGSVGCG